MRQRAVSYIEDNLQQFSPSLCGLINVKNQKPYSPKEYIEEKRNDGEYGDEPEIRALSQVLNRTIRVYEPYFLNKNFDGFSFKIEYTSIGNGTENPILLNFIDDKYAPHYQAIEQKKNQKSTSTQGKSISIQEKSIPSQENAQNHPLNSLKSYQVLKRSPNQYYSQRRNSNDKYNEILAYFQSGENKIVPKKP